MRAATAKGGVLLAGRKDRICLSNICFLHMVHWAEASGSSRASSSGSALQKRLDGQIMCRGSCANCYAKLADGLSAASFAAWPPPSDSPLMNQAEEAWEAMWKGPTGLGESPCSI